MVEFLMLNGSFLIPMRHDLLCARCWGAQVLELAGLVRDPDAAANLPSRGAGGGEVLELSGQVLDPDAARTSLWFGAGGGEVRELGGQVRDPMRGGPLSGSAPVAAKYVNSAGKFVTRCGANLSLAWRRWRQST
jgi:hypothetical protein